MLERVKSKAQLDAESVWDLLLESANTEMRLFNGVVDSSEKRYQQALVQKKISECQAELAKLDSNFQVYDAQLALLESCGAPGAALLKAVKENFSAAQIDFYTDVVRDGYALLSSHTSTITSYQIQAYRELAQLASGAPLFCNYPFFGNLLRKGLSKEMMNAANNCERNMQIFLKQPLVKM